MAIISQLTKRQSKRAKARILKRNAGEIRPDSKLDQKARELGVWSKDFHSLSRKDRHAIVARAFSMQKSA